MKITNTLQSGINLNNLSIAIKQIQAFLIALLVILSMILIPWEGANAAPVTGPIKWHPGHYYTILNHGRDKSWYMDQVYKELAATPALRGIQVRFLWADIEKTEGVYDFKVIDQLLAGLSSRGKRLVLQVQTKSFNPDWKLIPDYLKATQYEGGQFPFSTYGTKVLKGYNIKLWNPGVRDRLIALFRVLGNRYNSHPNFEAIGMIESALGQPISPLTSAQQDGFYTNMLTVHERMRAQFPNTMTIQEMNYPRDILEKSVAKFKQLGTALGCPDTAIEEPGLNFEGSKYSPKGVYKHYPELSGIIPLAPTVENINYESTRVDGTGPQPTISELIAFARDQLKANYIFWVRNPDHYPRVLETLNYTKQRSTPSGGLNSACPTTFASCVN
ncbi:MAG: beta-galactosidase [Nitrosomonas sp.]|jgi:hypothetical protein|nr:beta-galactosidase [Nitrosomonas sp.]MBP7113761.1 beta-galactosidase [Nitrosomonas sp.]